MSHTDELNSVAVYRPPRLVSFGPGAGTKHLRFTWLLPLLLLYVIGGAIQYLGWLSPTKCNIIALSILCLLLRYRGFWRAAKYEVPVLMLVGYFVVSGFARGTSLLSTSVYLYYSACLLLAAPAGRMLANELVTKGRVRITKRVLVTGLALQVPITVLQHQYATEFATHAAFRVGAIDAVFGTFQLNSDSVLGASCIMMVLMYSYTSKRISHALFIIGLSLAIIFLGHSKAMQGTYTILMLPILCVNFYHQTRLKKYRSTLVLLGWLFAIVTLALVARTIYDGWTQFRSIALSNYSTRHDWVAATRLAPWGELFQSDLVHLLFGNGALTYYNPITKEWLYNAGFSTIYSLSIDFGLVGLLGYMVYQVKLIFSVSPYRTFAIFLCVVWLAFVSFNDVLPNVAFIFALNFAMSFVAQHVRATQEKSPQDQLKWGYLT